MTDLVTGLHIGQDIADKFFEAKQTGLKTVFAVDNPKGGAMITQALMDTFNRSLAIVTDSFDENYLLPNVLLGEIKSKPDAKIMILVTGVDVDALDFFKSKFFKSSKWFLECIVPRVSDGGNVQMRFLPSVSGPRRVIADETNWCVDSQQVQGRIIVDLNNPDNPAAALKNFLNTWESARPVNAARINNYLKPAGH